MFIPSNRLRMVDTPDAPTPGAVPPVVPPVAPPGYTAPAAAAAPAAGPAVPVAPAAPGGPKQPMSKGLLIGLIAGGAALIVVAIVAVVALVLPSLLGGSTDTVQVADLADEPDTTWKFDWVGDNDQEFLDSAPRTVAVGDDMALVWADFDYYAYSDSQGNSYGWYEGYNEQYSEGYDAGLEYAVDYEAYWDDFSGDVPYPDQEDYFPEGAYDDYDGEFRGFSDGFYDAAYDQGEGYSELEEPVEPDFTPTLTLLNVVNGDEVWTIDLADAIDGADYQSSLSAIDIEDSNAIVISAAVIDGDSYTTTAAALDKGTGEVISSIEADGAIYAASFGGDVLLAVDAKDKGDFVLGRYSVNALDDDPKWDTDVQETYGMRVLGDFVQVTGTSSSDEAEVYDANTGEDAKWDGDQPTDDGDSVTNYLVNSQLIRVEGDDKGYQVDGINFEGDSVWDDSVESEMAPFTYQGAIFVAEEDGDAYSELQRINPSNGSEMWSDPYGDEFDYVLGVQGNSLLLTTGSKIVVLDLGSGEERFTQKSDDLYNIWLGANQYYAFTGDELAAYSYGEKGDVWTLKVDDSEDIKVLGKHFVLVDSDKGTLNGLGVK
jgi:hypothetical protein